MKALNPRSLFGSIFNLVVGLVLALSAAVFAFQAVPVTRLGAARPEAAWAFFWGRATALVVLLEGDFVLIESGFVPVLQRRYNMHSNLFPFFSSKNSLCWLWL